MKKTKHSRQRQHLARVKKNKKNRVRRLSASHRLTIIDPEVVEEKREELRKDTTRLFHQPFPPIILGIAERKRKRRYEFQKKF